MTSPSLTALRAIAAKAAHPLPVDISLQSVGAANGLKEIQSGSSSLVADVLDGDEIGDVDQGLEARELSREQLVDRGSGDRGAVLDDRRRQRVLGPEMEVHRALGDFRIGENVVEADQAVRLACELARSRAEDLQPCGVRSSIELFGHFRTSESGQWLLWAGNRGFRRLNESPDSFTRGPEKAGAPVLQGKPVNGPPRYAPRSGSRGKQIANTLSHL